MYWAKLFEGKWKDCGLGLQVSATNVEDFFRIVKRNFTKNINRGQLFFVVSHPDAAKGQVQGYTIILSSDASLLSILAIHHPGE